MKLLSIVFVSIILYSCGEREVLKVNVSPLRAMEEPVRSCSDYLSMFHPFSSDTFKIESPDQEESQSKNPFFGRELASSLYSFIDTTVIQRTDGASKVFACFKRKLSDGNYLLIMRTPGEYWESTIELFVFDSLAQKNIAHLEVAESWGDAGDSMVKRSYLMKENNKYRLILFRYDCFFDQTECTDSVSFYEIGDHISLIKASLFDSSAAYSRLLRH
ncbi:MAG: hypothetical protein ACKOXB_06485 [Flavobacteriales bacterium]